jgi:hypothetical protein
MSANERGHGPAAMNIPQVMENNRDELVVVPAGYADRMERFVSANPGFRSRIAYRFDRPGYQNDELEQITANMLAWQAIVPDEGGKTVMAEGIADRRTLPHFAKARSIRNALDHARLRQADRLVATAKGPLDADAFSTITAEDNRASHVFRGGLVHERKDTP